MNTEKLHELCARLKLAFAAFFAMPLTSLLNRTTALSQRTFKCAPFCVPISHKAKSMNTVKNKPKTIVRPQLY